MSDTESPVIFNFESAIPILSVGGFASLLTLLFCCYLWRLRRQGEDEQGYRTVRFSNKGQMCNDTCAVCLEDFAFAEELGICPCGHGFHKKCIAKWLYEKTSCPMCNMKVREDERTRLVGGIEALRMYRADV
ncbi:RING finger protein 24-like [Glandiceps talaboti]